MERGLRSAYVCVQISVFWLSAENDGERGKSFSKQDQRVLWGLYGKWNIKNVLQRYYDPERYKDGQKIRNMFRWEVYYQPLLR